MKYRSLVQLGFKPWKTVRSHSDEPTTSAHFIIVGLFYEMLVGNINFKGFVLKLCLEINFQIKVFIYDQ